MLWLSVASSAPFCARDAHKHFNFKAHISLYKYITCFPLMYFTTIQRSIYIYFFPDLVLHLFTFLCSSKIVVLLILDFIQLLCTRDFSRVTFATDLPTNLVYKSIFVIDYNYISIHLLFFFTVKLSIFSRLSLKHKREMNRSTHTEIYKFYTDLKKNCAGIGSVSVLKKWYLSHPYSLQQCCDITDTWDRSDRYPDPAENANIEAIPIPNIGSAHP